MMNQRYEPVITLDDRPDREDVIGKDEIIGLIIDLETMAPGDFFKVYFSNSPRRRE